MEASFPHLALWQTAQFYIEGQSLDVQESITGAEAIVPVMRGRWMASASFALRGQAATLQWRGFLAQMQGRIGTTLVPARSRFRPRDRLGRALAFSAPAAGPAAVHVTAATNAALRATVIDVEYVDTTGLLPGHFFSLGDRLYQVQSVEAGEAGPRITFHPPLRAAVAEGDALEIARPVCRMRFSSETEGLFDMSLAVLPTVSVAFREAI